MKPSKVINCIVLLLISLPFYCQNAKTLSAIDLLRKGYIVYSFDEIQKQSQLGDVYAQFFLGKYFEIGIGTAINYNEAFRYYRKTAEKGLAVGQAALSNCYLNGIGINKDSSKAEYWNNKAKGKYDVAHLSLIKRCYEEGLNHSENYALNPNEKSQDLNVSQTSNNQNTIVNQNQIVNNTTVQ